MKRLVILLAILLPAWAHAQPTTAPAVDDRAQVPYRAAIKIRDGKEDERFFKAHARFLDRIKQGPISLLLIGDSITAGWTKHRELFEKTFGPYQPALFGVSGDRTQHLLWRLENGELAIAPPPKVVMLMIGANNVRRDSAGDIAKGIEAIVSLVRAKHPTAKVLLIGTLPMGPDPRQPATAAEREKVKQINKTIGKLATPGGEVVFLDIGPRYLNDDGTSSDAMRADGVHLEARGYEIWADAVKPVLAEMTK